MRICITDNHFAWERPEGSPAPVTCKWHFDLPPDAQLLVALRMHPGKGHNDFPVRVLWWVHLLRHVTMDTCLAELGHNPALPKLAGIAEGCKPPEAWNLILE